MESIFLKNGAEESRILVTVTMMSLKALLEDASGAIAFYELNEKCKNPAHNFFSDAIIEQLRSLSLIDSSENVHSSIRNIVISAAEGEGLNLCLGSPVAEGSV
jgi:hypothetical protein